MIAAGELRHLVTLQRKNVTARDVMGGETFTWVDVAQERAAARPLAGREPVLADQRQAETTVEFEMRYREVSQEWRLVWQSRAYEIRSVNDVDGRGRALRIVASTGLRDG